MIASILLALGGIVAAQESPAASIYSNPLLAKGLIYSYCDGFRHDSIPTAAKQLQAWGPYYNISFDWTEKQTDIRNLSQYDVMVFVSSTGNMFDTAGQTAFTDFINKGGNFAAIHAASAAYLEKAWAPWTQTLGATFDHHPNFQTATFVKEMTGHPATNDQPDRWTFGEEVYSFTSNPRGLGAKVLWSVDPKSYNDSGEVPAQGTPHPIAWYQDYAAGAVVSSGSGPGVPGRSFYSSLGHANETWMDATFMKHIMGGISWTLASNTTKVAKGLYGGTDPTVRTGATNNATTGAANVGTPVLGSDQVAPSPPPSKSTSGSGSSSASVPQSTGGSSSSASTSGASVSVPAGAWALAGIALGGILTAAF
ncbi:unnamed protein product [Rhizoctonia solani]|uniref:ThuA-like domain-containing protein n=1 Tax=Rhizoctonia solani TaxID=456999 RepID=A0A8H3DLY1_9AGAM|nr:unnamed protein product [Rhizoctonia solani]